MIPEREGAVVKFVKENPTIQRTCPTNSSSRTTVVNYKALYTASLQMNSEIEGKKASTT